MATLTKDQIGLIGIYADRVATFKKYWVINCIGGARKVCGQAEAKREMIYWAHEAYEIGLELGIPKNEIHDQILWAVSCYEKEAA